MEEEFGIIHGVPVLKAIAKTSGDGWKDEREKGEVLYVWGVAHKPPYTPDSLLRIGYALENSWTLTARNYEIQRLTTHEFYQLQRLIGGNKSEAENILKQLKNGDLELADIDSLVRRSSSIEASIVILD